MCKEKRQELVVAELQQKNSWKQLQPKGKANKFCVANFKPPPSSTTTLGHRIIHVFPLCFFISAFFLDWRNAIKSDVNSYTVYWQQFLIHYFYYHTCLATNKRSACNVNSEWLIIRPIVYIGFTNCSMLQ